ncbi:hypothetical protein AVEN_254409-1 [Araneus ventricosus]|uniref:Uncharacterized protein n=1 Tax=Araneus ventricosus TaxID=182803 RepID=A0A4Y2IH08_ARAVE|nr:hypothetical protein AVEN_254409-1 [Araneus ventricosus]
MPSPLARHLSEEDLRACIEESSPLLALICDFPCHIQAVERYVKAVTDASSKVCGSSALDGYNGTRIVDKTIMPAFDTMAEYKPRIIDK